MEKNITYLKDIESVDSPFKFPKDLLTAYQPERLSEKTRKGSDSLNYMETYRGRSEEFSPPK